MTYRDIEQEALATEAIREYNVVALGDGENPGDERHAAIMAMIARIIGVVAARPVGLPAADEYYKEVGYFFRG